MGILSALLVLLAFIRCCGGGAGGPGRHVLRRDARAGLGGIGGRILLVWLMFSTPLGVKAVSSVSGFSRVGARRWYLTRRQQDDGTRQCVLPVG